MKTAFGLKKFIMATALALSGIAFGQVGINTDTPAATLQVVHKATGQTPAGIIAPRLTGDDLAAADGNYTTAQDGAMVYVTQPVASASAKTKYVTKIGYYSYEANSQLWIPFGAGTEPWYSVAGSAPATSNNEDIYQTGKVGVGSSSIHSSAIFQATASDKGILIPEMSTANRNQIASPADGLLIYNTSTGCYNYYKTGISKWLSICGQEDPAIFSITDCSVPSGAQGTYTQGTSLNSSNTYTIKVNISQTGPYTILGTTGNGYSFSKSGTFTSTGNQTLVLEGQGTPSTGPAINTLTLVFNGSPAAMPCTLPGITVNGSSTAFTVNCSGVTVAGIYYNGIATDNTQYIDVPVTSVTTPGNAVVETNTVNGIKFSSGTVNITPSTTSIRLYAQGTPTTTGTFAYSFTAPGSAACSGINVTVKSSLGTFGNPADRCLKILQEDSTSPDGEYFIKGVNGTAVKTYCDMTNGGYTMIQSFSEKTVISGDTDVRNNQNLNWNGNKNYAAATGASGVVVYENFLLPLSVRQSVRSNTTGNFYRARVVHDVANVKNNNDTWANNNYAVFDFSNADTYDFIGNGGWAIYSVKFTSKLFGKDFTNTATGTGTPTFNGTTFNYVTTWNVAGARVISLNAGDAAGIGQPNVPFSYISYDGATVVNQNIRDLNDHFHLYPAETQINHHIGKCGNATASDIAGVANCAGNARVPHSFNNGEGRYIQWFVK